MYNSKLFAILPDYIVTPDGMEVDRHGNLVLSCPNFADDSVPGVVVRFDKDRNISKWFEVPVHPEIGVARNMGICFDEDYNIYIVDNPGWKADRPDWANKGRILKVTVDDDGNILSWKTIATGMEHPNGIKYHNGYLYVTESSMTPVKDPSGKLVSGIYRFSPDEENIEITNTLEDKNLIDWYITNDPDCQYGLDGIVFDAEGNLFVGNFGDGEIWKIELDEKGLVKSKKPFAKDPKQLKSTDGMFIDKDGMMYIADFSANAICRMTPDGKLERIAESPDSDGLHGELDQPGEPIVWNGLLIASCFDLVTDPGKVNTQHELPATMACIEL